MFLFFILLQSCVNSELVDSKRIYSSLLTNNSKILNYIEENKEENLINSLKQIDWTDPLILETLFSNKAFMKILEKSTPDNKISIFKTIKAFNSKIIFNNGSFIQGNESLKEFSTFILTHLDSLDKFISFSLDLSHFGNKYSVFSDEMNPFFLNILNYLKKFLNANKGTLKILHLDYFSKINEKYLPINSIKNLPYLIDLSLVSFQFFNTWCIINSTLSFNDFFKNLKQLRTLNLSFNAFSETFPDLSFLKELENLNLSLTYLTSESTSSSELDLPALKILDLSNSIQHFQGELPHKFSNNFFKKLPKLEALTLKSNGLTSLPTDLTSVIATLKFLDISDNNLPSLPEYIYADGTLLNELYFESNYDKKSYKFDLPLDSFKKLLNLQYSTISGSQAGYEKKYPNIKFQRNNQSPFIKRGG